jgi:hypothetical protein
MNIFLVIQNPESKYNDEFGKRYDYPTSIPNGKQISVGDCLIFMVNSKSAQKLKFGNKRIIGLGKIDEITLYNVKEKEMALASYEWYKKFDPPLSFQEIGGDPRINEQHSMNKIDNERYLEILLQIIKNI